MTVDNSAYKVLIVFIEMKFMKDPLVISCLLITIISVGIILTTLRGSRDDAKARSKYQQKLIKSKKKFPGSTDLKSR